MPGAGFFVAPGTVVTCVHVIGDSAGLTVRWERDGAAPVELPVTGPPLILPGRGRPVRNLDRDYPDIAVLTVEAPEGHPCVRMDLVRPGHGDQVVVFGYPEEGGSVHLTPAGLTYRGRHGTSPTSFWDLGADTVKPGMSGAAALHLRSGGVGGIIVASKNTGKADGALAVPWREVERDLGAVLAANRAFHEADHRWNDAVRIAAAQLAAAGTPAEPTDAEALGTSQQFGTDLPARREDFFGRDSALGKLDSALASAWQASKPVVVNVTGLGGVGKTTLVRQWAAGVLDREERIRPDDYFFIDLGGFEFSSNGKVKPEEALERLIRQLTRGVQGAKATDDTAALVRRFREKAALRTFLLIILDNALDEEHVRHLIPVAGRALVIITSRRPRMNGLTVTDGFDVHGIEITRLSSKESLGLFMKSIGRTRLKEPELAREIVGYCCGLPLAIRIAAALIQSARYSMRELAENLMEPDTRFMMLHTGDEATDLSPVFRASYCRLSEDGQRAFGLLGLRPGQNIDDFAVAWLAGTGIADAAFLLREMHDVGLAEKIGNRFALHDLLHGFASRLAPEEGSEAWRAALSRALNEYYWYVNYEFDSRNENNPMVDVAYLRDQRRLAPGARNPIKSSSDWFEAERANLVDLVRRSCDARPPLERAPLLAFSLFYRLEAGGHWAEWDTVNQQGYRAAIELGDTFSRARLKRNIGRLEFVKIRDQAEALAIGDARDEDKERWIRDQCRHALELFKESLRLYEECSFEQTGEVVTVYREIADVHLELARLDPAEARQAERAYLEARARYEKRRDPENPIASLNVSLSAAYRIAGGPEDYDKAEECLRSALEYARKPGRHGHPKHPRVVGYGWLRWAELNEARGGPGDFEDAITCYDRAIEAFHDDGNPVSEARTLARKGRLLARMSRAEEALVPMTQARKILVRQHHTDEAKVVQAWITQFPDPGGELTRMEGQS
jgi:tetratricopeptide (TPR) repeat protein